MSITIESNNFTQEELEQAIEANGGTVQPKEPAAETKGEVVEGEPSGKPAEETQAGDTTAVESETAETTPQETTQQGKEDEHQEEEHIETPPTETGKTKARGGFQKRVDLLTRQLGEARESTEAERVEKATIAARLTEAEAELARLKPTEPEKAATPVKPTRPAMPSVTDFDYDMDKFNAAMKKYSTDVEAYDEAYDKYRDAVADRNLQETLAAKEAERQQAEQAARDQSRVEAYKARVFKDKASYSDFDELAAMLGEKEVFLDPALGPVTDYIADESENPAHLTYFFLDDFLNNDSAEAKRISQLKPTARLIEAKAIEDRLIGEHKGSGTKPPKQEQTPVAGATTESGKPTAGKPPVTTKPPSRTPEPPITTVGSRAQSVVKTYEEQLDVASKAGNSKEVRRLMDAHQAELRQRLVPAAATR